MTYAILLISTGRWQQANTQQPIGVFGLVIIHVNVSITTDRLSSISFLRLSLSALYAVGSNRGKWWDPRNTQHSTHSK